jgi:hypothetical protein
MDESNGIRPDNSSNPQPEKLSLSGERQAIDTDAPALGTQAKESNPDLEPESAERKRTTVRVEYRHSPATRWMHWINFPLLFVMIYSGILIYWADS